ncbi:hypothetical protein CHS0354_004173, partial [Potamilus streckersoni]
ENNQARPKRLKNYKGASVPGQSSNVSENWDKQQASRLLEVESMITKVQNALRTLHVS